MSLSVEIWKSIENEKINKANLTNEQSEELNQIDNYLNEFIDSLGFEQRAGDWYKTKTGYSFNQHCNQIKDSRCKSKWSLKVNVFSSRAEVYFCKRCEHVNC